MLCFADAELDLPDLIRQLFQHEEPKGITIEPGRTKSVRCDSHDRPTGYPRHRIRSHHYSLVCDAFNNCGIGLVLDDYGSMLPICKQIWSEYTAALFRRTQIALVNLDKTNMSDIMGVLTIS
jgi:hypothetical protein